MKIKLKDVEIENFNNISKAKIDLSNAYTILRGENGSGKTSVIDAIALCLNSYKRADKFSELVKDDEKESHIILNGMFDNSKFNIDLTIDSKSSGLTRKMTIEGEDSPYTNSEIDTKLKELGLNTYCDIMFSMQNDLDITKMNQTQRVAVIQKYFAFGLEEKTAKLKSEYEDLKAKAVATHDEISNITRVIESLKNTHMEKVPLPYSIEEVESFNKEIDNINKSFAEKDEEINNIEKEIIEYNSKINDVNTSISGLNTVKQSISLRETYSKNTISEDELKNIQSEIDGIKKEYEESLSTVSTAEKYQESSKNRLNEMQSVVWTKTAEVDALRKRLEKVSKGTCPECGRPYDAADINTAQSEYDISSKNLESLSKELDECKEDLEKTTKLLNEATSQRDTLSRSLDSTMNKLSSAKSKIEENSRIMEDFTNKIVEALKPYGISESEIDKKISDLSASLVDRSSEFNSKLQCLRNDKAELGIRANDINAKLKDQASALEKNTYIDQVNAKTEKDIQENEAKKDDLFAKSKTLDEKVLVYQEGVSMMEKTFPQFLILHACENLQKIMNKIIHSVFKDITIKMDYKKKSIDFTYSNGKKYRSLKQASGFEKAVASLAFKFALCKVYDLDLCILDEIDQASTEENSEKLFKFITETNMFNQVVLITHKLFVADIVTNSSSSSAVYFADKGKISRV